MQIVILTDYARNPLLICPMEFVFSLYYYYKGQFVYRVSQKNRKLLKSLLLNLNALPSS
jgi:hypothetical protein